MTFKEKALYNQIHPAKLATDISTSILTLYLFWQHDFWIALILHFLLAAIGSYFVIKYADLEKIKQSKSGLALKKYMTVGMQALRLVGDFITIFGAWYHSFLIIFLGLAVVLYGWYQVIQNRS